MLVGLGGLVLTIMLHKGWTVMTFDEWLEKNDPSLGDNCCDHPYREEDLKKAYEAGYEQGFQIGVDEGYWNGFYDGHNDNPNIF
jgi:hypothetical protein